MAIRTILNLPESLIAERNEYQRLFNLGTTKTTTGNLTFISTTSVKTYNTTGTIYANQGQVGLMNLLFNGDVSTPSNPKLKDYSWLSSDVDDVKDGLQTLTESVDKVEEKVLYNDKAIAELLMIADIDSKIFSTNLNKFYTNFSTTMDYSMGNVDQTSQLYTGTLALGASSVTVTSSTGFVTGQEISIQTATTYEEVVLLSVVGNTLNFKSNTTLAHTNPLIYRSNNSNQSFGGVDNKQLVPTNTVLGFHFNGDVVPFVGTLTAESNTGTFTTGLFGTQQISYNGSQHTQFPDTDYLNLGSGDFAIGCWLKKGTNNVLIYPFGQANVSTTQATTPFFVQFGADNKFAFQVSNGSAFSGITSLSAITDTTNLHYYVMGRSGNTLYLFIDGVLQGTLSFSGTLPNSTNKFCVGRLGEATNNQFNGSIEELIIVKGSFMDSAIQTKEYATSITNVTKNVIRMNITPFENVNSIACWLTKSELAGFTADGKVSIVGSSADESYVDLTESTTDLGSTNEVMMIGSVPIENSKVTLKIELNRASTSDSVSFTKLLGGVSA